MSGTLNGYRWIRHRPRPGGMRCGDETTWIVLEQSPSFYICYAPMEGYCLKRKLDYEDVPDDRLPL